MAHASLFPEPLDDYSLQLASKASLSHFQNVSGRARIKLKFPRAQALIYKVPRGEQELPTNQPVLHQICYHLFAQCSLPTANRSLSHNPPVLTPSSDYCFKQIYQQAMGKSVLVLPTIATTDQRQWEKRARGLRFDRIPY